MGQRGIRPGSVGRIERVEDHVGACAASMSIAARASILDELVPGGARRRRYAHLAGRPTTGIAKKRSRRASIRQAAPRTRDGAHGRCLAGDLRARFGATWRRSRARTVTRDQRSAKRSSGSSRPTDSARVRRAVGDDGPSTRRGARSGFAPPSDVARFQTSHPAAAAIAAPGAPPTRQRGWRPDGACNRIGRALGPAWPGDPAAG